MVCDERFEYVTKSKNVLQLGWLCLVNVLMLSLQLIGECLLFGGTFQQPIQ